MLRQTACIGLVLLFGCREKQPVAPSQEASNTQPATAQPQVSATVHPNKRIRTEIKDFVLAAMKSVDVDAVNQSENKKLVVYAYAFGAITNRVQDAGLQPVDAHAQALILYSDTFEMSYEDSAKMAQTMITKTADRTWTTIMEEGANDMQDWIKSGGKERPKRLAGLLSGTISELKATLGQGRAAAETTMQNIVSPEDLRKMLAAQHAVVFVGVDWSVNSNMARLHVQDFIKAWNQQNPGSDVTFYRLNLTEQKGPVWDAVGEWLHGQSVARQIMVAGAGSLIWVSKGKVDHSLLNAGTTSATELIETTRRSFNEPAVPPHGNK